MNENEQGLVSSEPRLNFKIILIIFIAIGLYLLIPKIIGLQYTLKLILAANKVFLVLALIFEIISYVGAAWLLGIILSRLGYRIAFMDRFRIGSIAAFAIHFFPVGSLGEGAVDYYFLRKRKVEAGSVLLTLVLRIIFTYLAFLALFLLGLALVPTHGYLSIAPKLVSLVLFLIIATGIVYMFYLYKNKVKFKQVWLRFWGFVNRIITRFSAKTVKEEKAIEIFEDIYQGIGLFKDKKRTSIIAVLAGILYWLGDVLCFYFVFASFSYKISFGVLIFGYGLATLAGMASFIPGGLGVTEGSMALLYSSLGVPGSLALIAILVFRFFSFWIWIPIGFYSYLTLRKNEALPTGVGGIFSSFGGAKSVHGESVQDESAEAPLSGAKEDK